MKLETDIIPRRDGKVVATVADTTYTFDTDASGRMVCDVDDRDVAYLLNTGLYHPAEEGDIDVAVQLASAENPVQPPVEGARTGKQGKQK